MTSRVPENETDVRQYFDDRAVDYRRRIYLSGSRNCQAHNQQRRRLHFRHLLEELGPRDRAQGLALDVGSGPGMIAHELLRRGYRTCGVDLAFNMLLENREHNGAGIALAQCSAEQLCYATDSLDLVTAAGTLEYVPDDDRALREMHRVLRAEGLLIISVPVPEWPPFLWLRRLLLRKVLRRGLPDVYHKSYRPAVFLGQLERAGFRPLRTISHHFVFFPMDYLFPRLSARLDLLLTRWLAGGSRAAGWGKSFIVAATARKRPGEAAGELRAS